MKSCPTEENLQAYLDGELAAEAGAALRAHLTACLHCAATAQEMEQSLAAIGRAFAVELPDAVPTARLRARIASALAEQAEPKVSWAQLFWRFGWAAVAVALVAGIIGWAWLGTTSIKQPQHVRSEKPAPSVTPLLSVPESMPEIAQQLPRPRHRVRPPARKNNVADAEAVTPFYPLREGEDLTALESAQLVRVELPGSALRDVGLPVDLETLPTAIKADVVLGQDGLARAIRFVR